MVRMYGTQQQLALAEVPIVDITRVWLDPSVLMLAKQHINANLGTGVFASVAEVKAFLQVELWLSFYNFSPTKFFDPLTKAMFPPVKKAMKPRRYFALLTALGTQSGRHSGASESWNAPFEHDRQLAHAMDGMRRVCSDIGFVKGVSIASLDDDLLRLRSAKVDDLGLTRTRNPAKGLVLLAGRYNNMFTHN
ncbi:hypothetical protein PF005_g31177 [Phytophthora fragariae]|uniref:PiggyBac transposable element-derived protein domain-containing protein n=1 Tax=Phytophthora fragariae TaxID=53985 RepID=A0A6A3RDJ9_9STRA|nr:hypothetical protein PF009_g31319 [Phytophthora fragariae]KAE9091210.1 hypothetical protein PF010_g18280 [Phytophthora fragariae]KAE9094650.1 hypothetical protein PF007_g17682 [Phytophthora fragariae]KAE9118885.1 hypothetical protein PF006_g18476 [Phytophthora fragariae]KAE9161608.1 hypothetical protein PF005_g31177 [Phytophthora fragariae]